MNFRSQQQIFNSFHAVSGIGIAVYTMLSYVTVAIACLYMIIFMNQYHCDDFKRFFVAHGENPDQYDKICKDIYSGESFRAAD